MFAPAVAPLTTDRSATSPHDQQVAAQHQGRLPNPPAHIDAIADPQARWDRLVEINVTEQVQNLAKTSIVQRAWHTAQRPTLHGWVYDLRTGYLQQVAMVPPGSKVDAIYRFDWTETH
jgi:carbonic anhydrase